MDRLLRKARSYQSYGDDHNTRHDDSDPGEQYLGLERAELDEPEKERAELDEPGKERAELDEPGKELAELFPYENLQMTKKVSSFLRFLRS